MKELSTEECSFRFSISRFLLPRQTNILLPTGAWSLFQMLWKLMQWGVCNCGEMWCCPQNSHRCVGGEIPRICPGLFCRGKNLHPYELTITVLIKYINILFVQIIYKYQLTIKCFLLFSFIHSVFLYLGYLFLFQGEQPDEEEVFALLASLKRIYAFYW